MSTIGNSYLNLIDLYKRTEDGKTAATIIELLKQYNPILEDAWATPCNMGTIHRHTIRTGLPSVSWGMLYKGVQQSKSRTQQVDDTTGFVEAMSSIDTRLVDLADNIPAVRLSEASSFAEAMNQEVATGLFYHDTATTPEKFKGLGARYSAYASGANNQGAEKQVINAGGVGSDNTSIWFVTWGDQFTSMLYPKNTRAGIMHQDMGQQRVLDVNNNPFFVLEDKWTWHVGLAVKDWRYNARIANIDVSDAQAGTVDLNRLMSRAYYTLQSTLRDVKGNGKQVIYMNRQMMEVLDNLSVGVGTAANPRLYITREEVQGQEVLKYRGIPIRATDAILNTEALVPAAS